LRDAGGTITRMPASITIAADGRRSAVARSVGLGSQPASPRRWAYGVYFRAAPAAGGEVFGEMHVRKGWYAGVVRVPGDRMNVCVVVDQPPSWLQPMELSRFCRGIDAELARGFAGLDPCGPVSILGPLAVDVTSAGVQAAGAVARVAPALVRRLIVRAGDAA
jgi:2-polyprenyl-6-methoxyphenol hydroxylase-like FAD-dependent oxidoreductase